MNTKILLLLALVICSASAKSIVGGSSRCLCQSFRDDVALSRKSIKSLKVIPPSNSCDNQEIILNLTSGLSICLNPSTLKIREVLRKLQAKRGMYWVQ